MQIKQVSNHNINRWITEIHNDFKTAVSVDCVIFGYDENTLKVLVSACDMPPFEQKNSLLGDLVHPDETLEEAAFRVLESKTGFSDVFLEQVQVFGAIDRHPLGRVITIAYYALIKIDDAHLAHVVKDTKLQWMAVSELKSMAFDHYEIMHMCLRKMRRQIRVQPIGFNLLPEKFTLLQLQNLYEVVLGIPLDKRNFRRKLTHLGILTQLDEMESSVSHRPARLYSFDKDAYDEKIVHGFNFDL
ncbi:MAG TPA: NUDIX hydrolase [Saprospiraceae bacterium]|nr:NUDIX hydrolase [Saprospiraceae bacterium]HRO07930.1 NUDIX hydrolase [Saprospiraceae bacterium]HRP41425.1 NUDIX hydrolase [Saprospiraceae bacterium]